MKIGSAETTYSFDPNSNRLVKSNNTIYGYNGANVTSIGNLNLRYDPFGNMLSGQKNGVSIGEYAYDGQNNRVRKQAGGETMNYYYDLSGNVLSEISAAGQAYYDYVYLNNTLVARVDRIASTDLDGDGISYGDEVGIYGTNPNVADTDGDGINDGAELAYWGAAWNQDADHDGLVNLLDPDSDNDGYLDGIEIKRGSNPADPSSTPGTVLAPIFEILFNNNK